MQIDVAAKTDIGRVRKCNEDSFLVLKTSKLFSVCDGMGGHKAGWHIPFEFFQQTIRTHVSILDIRRRMSGEVQGAFPIELSHFRGLPSQ